MKRIAQRLRRSENAVRLRLRTLGMSAKVTDGWSLRALQKLLRVSRARLRCLIGNGILRVRDPRVTAISLAAYCYKTARSWTMPLWKELQLLSPIQKMHSRGNEQQIS